MRDTGDPSTWKNLNGMWEWESASSSTPPFGKTLQGSILVPFPVESCLSGVAPSRSAPDHVMRMWYRLKFDLGDLTPERRMLLHFGAVDWQTVVYLNQVKVGNHTGGYDGFSFDITNHIQSNGNELLIYVYDPSDHGKQPNGKQVISSIWHPFGDQYTPSSGIWQTVWLESVPHEFVERLQINQASTTAVEFTAFTSSESVHYEILDEGKVIAQGQAQSGSPKVVPLPQINLKLWSPDSPHLYDLQITTAADKVISYFGLRTFALSINSVARPLLNGNFTFMAGFLDQSWWPDGQYTAPTDEALESDFVATKMFGFNMIRLHQKVNPERWYYFADKHGVIVFQDMIQKFYGATSATIPLFVDDLTAMIKGRGNHPCIVQWNMFNENDCWSVFKTKPFDVAGIVELAKNLDPTRLVDTDSGGSANNFHIGDVNDMHDYPNPPNPQASATQYAMIGEFGGLGAFIKGKEWVPGKCYAKKGVSGITPSQQTQDYVAMAATIASHVDHVSASVYTQTTDVELECDGFLNYDRTNKFTTEETTAIRRANEKMIIAGRQHLAQRDANLGSTELLSV